MRCHFLFFRQLFDDFSAQKAPEQCSEFYKSVVKGMQIKINAEALLTKRRKRKEEKLAKGKFHNSLQLPICLLIILITDKSNNY